MDHKVAFTNLSKFPMRLDGIGTFREKGSGHGGASGKADEYGRSKEHGGGFL